MGVTETRRKISPLVRWTVTRSSSSSELKGGTLSSRMKTPPTSDAHLRRDMSFLRLATASMRARALAVRFSCSRCVSSEASTSAVQMAMARRTVLPPGQGTGE